MNAKITFHELADLMAEATSTTSRVCELFLRELFATISQALIDGESVKVKGIGTFKITHVKSRKSANVNTGEPVEIAGYNKLTFTPDKSLAEAVNQPFAQFETVMLADEVTDDQLDEIDKQYPSGLTDEGLQPTADNAAPRPVKTEKADEPSPAAVEPEPEPIYAEDEPLPEQPDMPMAPLPFDLPEMEEAAPVPEDEEPAVPAEPAEKPKPVEKPKPIIEPSKPVERKPMLVGIPIDGPSQPVPQPEAEEEVNTNRHFYRPEPRNVYTPTPEQIEEAQRKPNRRWMWLVPSLIAAALVLWLGVRSCNGGQADLEEHVAVQADTVVTLDDEATDKAEDKGKQEKKAESTAQTTPESKQAGKPEVVTDIVTSQIVLTTLSEKHYGSPWFWVYIYEENRDIINNPNNIKPGTRVVIPPAEKYGIDRNNKSSLKKAQIKSMEILRRY